MDLAAHFLARTHHYLAHEYPVKLERCVSALPPEAVWARTGEDSNSVGNILVHLEGNVRQWILGGVGGAPDHRHRAAEFAAREGADGPTLMRALLKTLADADAVISGLGERQLAETRTIQGRDLTVFAAVYHVVEHFAMHVGQVILLTKQHAPGVVRFYEDAGGLARPLY